MKFDVQTKRFSLQLEIDAATLWTIAQILTWLAGYLSVVGMK